MDTRHASLVVDGVRLHWAECGAADDTVPLVLLHGINDSHLTWKHLAPLLAAGRRVLMPDLPGCGLSERPDAGYQLAWQAQLIGSWLKALSLPRVDLVGHSFGGGVAQTLLLDPQLDVRRLGLIASGGLGPRVGFWLRLAACPGGLVESFGQPFMAAGTRLSMWHHAGGAMSDEDIEQLSVMNAEQGSARAFARTVSDVISWRGQSRHFLTRAHEIPRLPPIMLLWGECDPITPIEDARAFANTVEGVTFKSFARCGHYVHHQEIDELSRSLIGFLDAPALEPARLPRPRKDGAISKRREHSLGAWVDALMPSMFARV